MFFITFFDKNKLYNLYVFIVFIVCFLLQSESLKANNYDLSDLIKIYFNIDSKDDNKSFIEVSYGMSLPEFSDKIFSESISRSYESKIEYGFVRNKINYLKSRLNSKSSESIYLSNVSSHFKPGLSDFRGFTIDSWIFGFKVKNGFSLDLSKQSKMFLNHSSVLQWNRIDFESNSKNARNDEMIAKFDQNFKFGAGFSPSIDIAINENFSFEFAYQHDIYYPEFDGAKWFGSFVFDNLSQQWVEFCEPILINKIDEYYPASKFIYKNLLSFATNEFRREQMFWPLKSKSSLNFDVFRFGITYTFD